MPETTPWQSKPGVDWSAIEARVRAGETFAAIARDLAEHGVKISAWAINKRARKHGWLRDKDKVPGTTDWLALTTSTATAKTLADPQDLGDRRIVHAGVRTPERMAEILTYIQIGASHKAAAQAAGTNHKTLANWLEDDPDFAELVSVAEGKMLVRNLERIDRAAEQDWRAADRLLSSVPAAREYWTPNAGGQPGASGITVVINVKRAGDTPTIDVTPDPAP